jgi:hypothetical protein
MGNKPVYKLLKSDKKNKKYMVITPENKKIYFGAGGYNDYIIYNKLRHPQAEEKKRNYLSRHKINEDWEKSGIDSPGFWSRWILWNMPTFEKSIKDTEKRFKISIN